MSPRASAIVVMDPDRIHDVLPPHVLARLEEDLSWVAPPTTAAAMAATPGLATVEVLVTGWGGPSLDAALLDAMPRLSLVAVASGSIRHVTTDAFWARDIPIVSAAAANAVPVVEFTVATIVLALKQTFRVARETRTASRPDKRGIHGPVGETVGILSLGLIGRGVVERLAPLPLDVRFHDPFAKDVEGARPETLERLFERSRVVSVHTPLLPETVGLVSGDLIARLPHGATLVNTARGAVVDEAALLDVLRDRPDLTAVLDVTDPEPPPLTSPLRTQPNVILTGHLAGSHGRERGRLGELVADEIRRHRRGEALQHAVDPQTARTRA